MNELDKNLLTGEAVVFATTKHWFAPIRASILAGLMIVAFIALGWLSPDNETGIIGTVGSLMDLVGTVLAIGGIAWIVYNLAEFLSAHFGVTNMRVLRYEGLLRRRSSETLLSMLTDVRLDEPAIGRMLGYGNLRILTSSGAAGEDQFMTVKDAAKLRTAINEQKAAMLRGEHLAASSAPAAAPAAVAPAAVAPAAVAPAPLAAPVAPPAPSAPAASPTPTSSAADDAAAALVRLGELHAQGLITDTDFETKKAEILDRI